MWRYIYTCKIIFCLILGGMLSACAHIEPWHNGIIIDEETNKPINYAKVTFSLHYTCYLPPNPGGASSDSFRNRVMFTKRDGRYTFLPKIYLMPPLACFSHLGGARFEHGRYFSDGFSSDQIPKIIFLRKKNHFLDYYQVENTGVTQNKLADWTEAQKRYNLIQADEPGVFLRLPGRKCTQMYTRKLDVHSRFGAVHYLFDEASQQWVVLKGSYLCDDYTHNPSVTYARYNKILKIISSPLPSWRYMDSAFDKYSPVFANAGMIFYPDMRKKPQQCSKFRHNSHSNRKDILPDYECKTSILYADPHKGNISGLAGSSRNLITIEDSGKLLCFYDGFKHPLSFSFSKKPDDFPLPDADDSMENAQFKFISCPYEDTYLIVIRTQKNWHIYFMGRSQKGHEAIRHHTSFTSENEITAITAADGKLFIAFKDDGIRKFNKDLEDPSFFENSKDVPLKNVVSLVLCGNDLQHNFFATMGDDKIYRLSKDGTPDFIVKENGP